MPPSGHPFDQLVQREDTQIRLAEAALLFAADHCQNLKPACWLMRLDALAKRVEAHRARIPADRIAALRSVLVDEEGFSGNTSDYYDPCNSLLNKVLERKTGIPITLSVIWLDIGSQLGWPLAGVGLPGHYVIKWQCPGSDTLIDPFTQGRTLDREDCQRLVSAVTGQPTVLTDEHFEPAPVRFTLARMLHNLLGAYVQRQTWGSVVHVLERLLALHPRSPDLRRQLAIAKGNLASLN
jgi:regulator of sirC expression with transglutaminase-like and TPR domain